MILYNNVWHEHQTYNKVPYYQHYCLSYAICYWLDGMLWGWQVRLIDYFHKMYVGWWVPSTYHIPTILIIIMWRSVCHTLNWNEMKNKIFSMLVLISWGQKCVWIIYKYIYIPQKLPKKTATTSSTASSNTRTLTLSLPVSDGLCVCMCMCMCK